MSHPVNHVLLNPANLVGTDLSSWLDVGGSEGFKKALANPGGIIETLEQSGLRGMGGAGFPTWRKWDAVAQQKGADKWLICNGNEDEPGTFKDRLLLEKGPHQVVEGMLIAAVATGANHLVAYINPHETEAMENMRQVINQWRDWLADNPDLALDLKLFDVVESSGFYIGGEESAATTWVGGGDFPFPKAKPPYPFEAGVNGQPTLINNTETYAHVCHILRDGPEWYRGLGLGDAVGTKIYSLSGDIQNPGAYELPMGITLRELIDDFGGGMLAGKAFKAVFTGGPSNTLLNADDLDARLDFDSLKAKHSGLGTGAMIVVSEETDIVRHVAGYVEFFANSSCGQCPPCKIGTRQACSLLRKIEQGRGHTSDLNELINLAEMLPGSGRCGLVTGAATVIRSSLEKFRPDYINIINR
jgi:NADH-quinone oxidoreductase subunit F